MISKEVLEMSLINTSPKTLEVLRKYSPECYTTIVRLKKERKQELEVINNNKEEP